jgi:hypothetical protein
MLTQISPLQIWHPIAQFKRQMLMKSIVQTAALRYF